MRTAFIVAVLVIVVAINLSCVGLGAGCCRRRLQYTPRRRLGNLGSQSELGLKFLRRPGREESRRKGSSETFVGAAELIALRAEFGCGRTGRAGESWCLKRAAGRRSRECWWSREYSRSPPENRWPIGRGRRPMAR